MAATRSGRKSSQQYVAEPMPAFVEFQHPRLVAEPPSSSGWIHEIKFDGYRLQVRVRTGEVTIFTRNGHDWTDKFPEIARDAAQLPDCILDAELCALDARGQPSFSKLRASITPGRTKALVLFVFDCLWGDGQDLRSFALMTRKAVLRKILDQAPTPSRMRVVDHFETGGRNLLTSACQMELEGIVSKRADGPYRAGKGESWVKSKCRPGQEVVIGGWKQEPVGAFKALLVGVYQGGKLTYAGSIKTGFSGSGDLLARLRALEVQVTPFAAGDPPRKASDIHWVRPELVAAAEIAEWTASGKLRQASFKGLREDKAATEVVREV